MTQLAWYFCGAVVALIVLLSIGSALTGRGYRFASGSVQGVIGKMGSGKSLFVVTRVILPAARAMSKKRGLICTHTGRPVTKIITNFEMELPYDVDLITLDGSRLWDDLVERCQAGRLDALVIIDEAHLYLPSAKMKMAQKAAWVCSMARKLNAEIWWISQNEMKIHKRLRDDSQLIWKVQRSAAWYTLITGPSSWFVARAYEPERIRALAGTPEDQRRYKMTKQALAAYDSFELIVPDAEADVSLDSLSTRGRLVAVPQMNEAGPTKADLIPDPPIEAGADLDADANTG